MLGASRPECRLTQSRVACRGPSTVRLARRMKPFRAELSTVQRGAGRGRPEVVYGTLDLRKCVEEGTFDLCD
jgi:hypothetical protein